MTHTPNITTTSEDSGGDPFCLEGEGWGEGAGREVFYNYPASGPGSVLSRLDNIANDSSGTTKYATYTYLGAGTVVTTDRPAVSGGLKLDYTNPAGGDPTDYDGFDRFGRIVHQKWTNTAGNTTRDHYTYGYDYAGNRVHRTNKLQPETVQVGQDQIHTHKAEIYTHDDLHRLTYTARGPINTTTGGVYSMTFAQDWSLDTLNNWAIFKQDDNGNTTWDLNQTRDHNQANEITDITGGSWIEPVHDKAGNMTVMPKPGDEAVELRAIYDAWNRMVEVRDDEDDLIAQYRYNGLHHRVIEHLADTDETRFIFYNTGWQVLEERVDDLPNDAHTQYIWCQRYIDAPVLRFRDTTPGGNGQLDETRYYTNDANMNVIALVNPSGTVTERYEYTPYGQPTFHTADYSSSAAESSEDNRILFAGYRHDPVTGLYHVRHRYLHATMGRWTSEDPEQYIDGMNLYEYVGGGPTIFIDSYGRNRVSTRGPTIYQDKSGTSYLIGQSYDTTTRTRLTLGGTPIPTGDISTETLVKLAQRSDTLEDLRKLLEEQYTDGTYGDGRHFADYYHLRVTDKVCRDLGAGAAELDCSRKIALQITAFQTPYIAMATAEGFLAAAAGVYAYAMGWNPTGVAAGVASAGLSMKAVYDMNQVGQISVAGKYATKIYCVCNCSR